MNSTLSSLIVSKLSDYAFDQITGWMDEQEINTDEVKQIMSTVKQTVEARFQ